MNTWIPQAVSDRVLFVLAFLLIVGSMIGYVYLLLL